MKYEIDYYSRFTLNIFIIEDKGQKYFFEFFVSLKPGQYHNIADISIACDRKNEPALVTATYNIGDINLTSHIANYHAGMTPSEVSPAFIGLAGRIIPGNTTPTGVSLHNLTDIAGITDRLNGDEYFRTIDSFILPTAILKNLDPVRNKNNFDILAPIKKVEYIKQGQSYIVELDFGPVTLPMAISEHDILNHQAPQTGSRFHGVAWSQCYIR